MDLRTAVLMPSTRYRWIPSWRDLAAALLVMTIVILLGSGARQMATPFVMAAQPDISLSPWALPGYGLRTVMRMLAALGASLFFTLTYATLAAKSRADAVISIPLVQKSRQVNRGRRPCLSAVPNRDYSTAEFVCLSAKRTHGLNPRPRSPSLKD